MTKKFKFRYGFKAEAKWYSQEFRTELNIPLHQPLCPWKLAEHLAVPTIKLTNLPPLPETLYLISPKGQKDFSATAFYDGNRALVVYNDANHEKRQASDIAHELAHIVLGHPRTPLFDENGMRDYPVEIEEEAQWLGPELLVSEQAAMHAYKIINSGEFTLETLSDEWGITAQVIRMRINLVGAKRRFNRAA